MKFLDVAARITGLSTPVFGVSWHSKEREIDSARRVLTFLEDRRVLYYPGGMEVPSHCIGSVLEIRHYLTNELGRLIGSELEPSLRALRAACRKFLDTVNGDDHLIVVHASERGH